MVVSSSREPKCWWKVAGNSYQFWSRSVFFHWKSVWWWGLVAGEHGSAALCSRGLIFLVRQCGLAPWRWDSWRESGEKAHCSCWFRPAWKSSLSGSPYFSVWWVFFLLWNWNKINNTVLPSLKMHSLDEDTDPSWSLLLAENLPIIKGAPYFLNSFIIQCGCDLGFLFQSQVRQCFPGDSLGK